MRKDKPPLQPRDRALGLLSRREHSARELKRKLQQKGVAVDEATEVVGEMGERRRPGDDHRRLQRGDSVDGGDDEDLHRGGEEAAAPRPP